MRNGKIESRWKTSADEKYAEEESTFFSPSVHPSVCPFVACALHLRTRVHYIARRVRSVIRALQ